MADRRLSKRTQKARNPVAVCEFCGATFEREGGFTARQAADRVSRHKRIDCQDPFMVRIRRMTE